MKKYILITMAILSLTQQNTFANTFKDGDKVEISGYYISSLLESDGCGGGQLRMSEILNTSQIYGKYMKLAPSITCASHSIGLLTNNFKESDLLPTGKTYNKDGDNYGNISNYKSKIFDGYGLDGLEKTQPGEIILYPSVNFEKNIENNPLYLEYITNNLLKDNDNGNNDNIIRFLGQYLSLQETKYKTGGYYPHPKILVKGTYFHPKGTFKNTSPFSDKTSFNLDLSIIIVDDIAPVIEKVKPVTKKEEPKPIKEEVKPIAKTEETKSIVKEANPVKEEVQGYKYLAQKDMDKISNSFERLLEKRGVNVLDFEGIDKVFQELNTKLDTIISKSSGNKKEMWMEVKEYLNEGMLSLARLFH